MDRDEFRSLLGREPSATDQPPGYYKFRMKGRPWRAVHIVHMYGWWAVVIDGVRTASIAKDPADLGFILAFGPFHPISEEEYLNILRDYAEANERSPLKAPDQPINLRHADPL